MRNVPVDKYYVESLLKYAINTVDPKAIFDYEYGQWTAVLADCLGILRYKQLRKQLQWWFCVDIPDDKWDEFADNRSAGLSDFCKLLTDCGAVMPVIDKSESGMLATKDKLVCNSIIGIVKDKISDAQDITAETDIEKYLNESSDLFIRDIARLAPDSMPILSGTKKIIAVPFILLILTTVGAGVSGDNPALTFAFVLASVVLGVFVLAGYILMLIYDRVWYEGIKTFDDLAKRMAYGVEENYKLRQYHRFD